MLSPLENMSFFANLMNLLYSGSCLNLSGNVLKFNNLTAESQILYLPKLLILYVAIMYFLLAKLS